MLNVKNLRHWITPSKITPLPPVLHPRLLHARSTRASQLGQSYPPPALPVESEGYTVTPWFIWKSPLWMKGKIILKSNRFMTFQNVEKKIWGVSKAHFEIFVQLRLGSCLNTVTIKNGFPSLDCWFPGCCCGSQESTVGDPTPTLVDPKLTTDLGRNKPANNRCIQ